MLRDITKADKFMYCTSPMMIHKITPSVDFDYWMKRLDTQLNESTNQNSIKNPKVIIKLWGLVK